MMGRTHSATGAAAGAAVLLAAALLVANPSPLTWAVGIILAAGAALLPDADSDASTAYHALGPVSRIPCELLQLACRWTYLATRSPRDPVWPRVHRGLTHTLAFALITGLISGGLFSLNKWLVAPLLFYCGVLALKALNRSIPWNLKRIIYPGGGGPILPLLQILYPLAGTAALLGPVQWNPTYGWFLGGCITLGMICHDLGDACTDSAVPFLWPLPIGGRRWRLLGLPEALRISTGDQDSPVETIIRRVCLTAAAALFVWALVPHLFAGSVMPG